MKQLTAEVGFRNIKYKKKSRIDDKKFTIFKENSNNASIKINDTSSRITYINEKPEKSEYYYIKKVNFRQS
ncbi:hypothetical protein GH833_31925, partial [Bacillus thuringiensis]|nr:hypothetical protein [Bacillus thuringiensis]